MKLHPAWLLAAALGAAAQAVEIAPQSFQNTKTEAPFSVVAPRAEKAPAIDGELNDGCWDKAASVKSFWKSGTGEMAGDQAIAWVCFDSKNLYIAFACRDPKIKGGQHERDSNDVWKNDAVEVYLSPDRAAERERHFILGAGGSRWDAGPSPASQAASKDWNSSPDWEGAVKIQPWGYSAEILIPLDAFAETQKSPVASGTAWSLKLTRLDYGDHKGCHASSWTQIGGSADDEYSRGILIFEALPPGGLPKTEAPGMDPGSFCLTGNAPAPLKARNKKINGSYTYTDAMTAAPMFPRKSANSACDEPGRYAGPIPFESGKLTDGQTVTFTGFPQSWAGHQGQDITFDLGSEYEIARVDILGGRDMKAPSLYLKSPDEARYTLADTKCDLVEFDAKGYPEKTGKIVFGEVNQPARWVRLQVPSSGYSVAAEVQIWGREIEKGKRSPRKPYLQGGGDAPVKEPKDFPVDVSDIPLIYPAPREIKLGGPSLPLADGMAIAYEPVDSPRAKTTAEVLADEMAACFGLKMKVQAAAAGGESAILVGEAKNSPLTARRLAASALQLSESSPGPEGYVLAANGKQVVIGGSDERGAFYGCQALLAMVRRGAAGKPEAPGAVIRDWPATPYRMIMGRPKPSKDLIRTLARFRINYYQHTEYQNITVYIQMAAGVDPFAERYFVNLVPILDPDPIVLKKQPELVERGADEDPAKLGELKRVACPSNPKTWEIYFAYLDEWLPKFHSDRVTINYDERYQAAQGSRWNVCPLCRERNLSAPALFSDTINRMDKKLKEHGKKMVMVDSCLVPDLRLSHPGDPDPQWGKALGALPKDILFCVTHTNEVNELLKAGGFEQVYMFGSDRDWRGFDFPGEYYRGMVYYGGGGGLHKTGTYVAESQIAWNPGAPRPHDPKADETIAVNSARWVKLHENANVPSLMAGPSDFIPVDISKSANRSRVDEHPYDGRGWVDIGPNCDLRALKPGLQLMGGIPFQIIDETKNDGKGFVMLHNRGFIDRTLPDRVSIETGDLKASSLVFLHCLENRPGQNYLRRTELAGFLFMIYEDGAYSSHELKYAVNTANWDGLPVQWAYGVKAHTMKKGRLMWKGETLSGQNAFLYSSEWANPRPDLAIKKILFRTAYSISCMNPMLMAITAVKPDPMLAGIDTNAPLKKSALLEPARPEGNPLDLRGGRDESELKYAAPDGTIIECESIDNKNNDKAWNGNEDFRSYIGIVNCDGNEYVRFSGAGAVTYTFAQPRALSGLTVTGAYRNERKGEDFGPSIFECSVETNSGDGWKAAAETSPVSPEETGPVWVALDRNPVRQLRVSSSQGICNITLYEP